MLGFYNYTVVLTYIGMLSSMFGIMMAMSGRVNLSIACLMFSGLCDMYDGKIARTRKNSTEQEKRFGIQIDSLSDLICFGVLPGTIGYAVGLKEWYGILFIAVYVLAALIRLAYFNVMEEERQNKTTEKRKTYSGVPVTTVALFFPLLFTLRHLLKDCFALVYGISMVVIAFLFLSKLTIKKPGKAGTYIMLAIGCVEFILFLIIRHFFFR